MNRTIVNKSCSSSQQAISLKKSYFWGIFVLKNKESISAERTKWQSCSQIVLGLSRFYKYIFSPPVRITWAKLAQHCEEGPRRENNLSGIMKRVFYRIRLETGIMQDVIHKTQTFYYYTFPEFLQIRVKDIKAGHDKWSATCKHGNTILLVERNNSQMSFEDYIYNTFERNQLRWALIKGTKMLENFEYAHQ